MASVTEQAAWGRPRFGDGQVLGADDLAAEQEYLIAVRRRHHRCGHTPGIVAGLELSVEGGVVTVSAGLAIDGYGRELLVSEATTVPQPSGTAALTGDVGIYVQYSRVAVPGTDSAHPRWAEQPDFLQAPSAVMPPDVDLTDLPVDATAPAWPVLLGRLKHGKAGLDLSGRRYAGAVGSVISAPQGSSRIAFGRSRSVSVSLGGSPTPALAVDVGGTTISGEAFIGGPLTVGIPAAARAAPAADVPVAAAVPAPCRVDLQRRPPPTAASPWSLYRTLRPATRAVATTPAEPAAEELRIELPAPPAGPNPTQQAVSFGAQSDGVTFGRTLSLLIDGTVIINGDLQIDGRLATAPVPIDASDSGVQQALVQNFIRGAQIAAEALEELYTGELTLEEPRLSAEDGEIFCSVAVRNTGAVTLTSITVSASVTRATAPTAAPKVTLARGIRLDPSASQRVEGKLTAPGTDDMTVHMHAVGKGLKGTPIQATDLTGPVRVRGGASP